MSKDKTRSLMRRPVVLKSIADSGPEGVLVAHEDGWPITRELRRMEKEGLIRRYRTGAVAKRSPSVQPRRPMPARGPTRFTKFRITPAGRDLLARRYRPKEAEALLSGVLCDAIQCRRIAGCSLLCRIAWQQRAARRLRAHLNKVEATSS